jgi:hypothetical protein
MGSDVRVAMDRAVFALDSIDINQKPNGDDMDLKELVALAIEQGKTLKTLNNAMDGMTKDMTDMKKSAKDMYDKEEKTAEDMEEEEAKKKAEDEKAEKEKEKSEAMDSAIEKLTAEIKTLKSTAMDGNAVMKSFAAKQSLASQVSQIVGAFDHADMDAQGVAKYGLEKMGVACDSGSELAMMKGILHSRKTPTFTVDHGNAQDGAEKATSANLDKLGL